LSEVFARPDARPARVSFQQQIKGADAVSLRHTEYNRSVPGALENALDVASRPLREERVGRQIRWGGDQCLTQARALGGFGMNHHLRSFLIVRAMPELEAYFGAAANLFDAQEKLTNESTCDFPESFAASIEAIGSGQIDELEEAMAQMASFRATVAWLQQQQEG